MRYPICILIVSGLTAACFGQVEFVGLSETAEGKRFVLRDTKEKETSEFLRLEQSFRGIRLVAYDQKREILMVEKNGDRFELPLRTPQVHTGTASDQVLDPPKKYKVGDIVIKAAGDVVVSEAVVRDSMQIRAGGTFDNESLDQDIRSIYRTGQFKFVEIKHEKRSDDAFNLIITVTPKSQ